MNPFLINSRTVFFTSLVWLLIGSLFASLMVIAQGAAWINAFVFALPMSFIFGFISSSAYYVCRSLPMQKRRFFLVCGLFGGTSLISGLLALLIALIWNKASVALALPWAGIVIENHLATLIFFSASLLFLLSILAYDVLIAFENIRQAERREATSQVLTREAELQVLRTQINPHFLFNSLNSISALTTIDPAAARQMTIELAQFFRMTLALSELQKITLAEELILCQHFLAIEKIRFGKKLQTTMEITDESQECLLPPMLLQPLLENAIKHGIRDLIEGGTIEVRSKLQDQWLYISVENPIEAQPCQAQGTGTGLKNLQARMSSLYGDRSRFIWSKTDARFRVEIALPIERV